MPKISIVIPVYNVYKYLDRCINSILNQSFTDYELILINDGSTDNSEEIAKKYLKDKRVILYNQKNMGPALTRNKGIKLSKGDYIMFIDSDDYIEDDYLKSYYDEVCKDDCDLVIGGYKKVDESHVNFIRKLRNGEFAKYLVMGPVCKLYKRQFLIKNKITFLNTTASEDIYFNALAYSKNPKIRIIDNIGYIYYYNSNSLSNTLHKGFNQNVDILGLVTNINYKNIKNVLLNQYFIIRYLVWYLLYSGKTATKEQFMYEYKKLFSWLKVNIPNYRKNKYILLCPKGEQYHIHLCIHIFIILEKLGLIGLFAKIYCKGDKDE